MDSSDSLCDVIRIPHNFVLGSPEDNEETSADPKKVYIQPLAQVSFMQIAFDQDKSTEKSQYFGDAMNFYHLYKEYIGKRSEDLQDLHSKLVELGFLTHLEVVQIMGLDLGGCRKFTGPAIDVVLEELPSIRQKGLNREQMDKLNIVLNEYCSCH